VREERQAAEHHEAPDQAGTHRQQQELDDAALDERVPERLEHGGESIG
jgi:hypothetical protein